jgi:hypothetical protein
LDPDVAAHGGDQRVEGEQDRGQGAQGLGKSPRIMAPTMLPNMVINSQGKRIRA